MVPNSIAAKVTYGGSFKKSHIVIHETASTGKGAGADAHARLQANGNSRQASWNYQIDDKEVVQSFPDTAGCWHASNATYNKNSIGIEICVNSDSNYLKAVENAIELTKHLMNKHGIPTDNVIQHHTTSGGKNCPAQMRSGNYGITWNQFKKKIGEKGKSKVSGSTGGGSSSSSKGSSWNDVGSKWTGQTLKKNDRGGAVKQLQKLVGVTADGMFGKDTAAAVRKAQKKAGIAADEMAGKDTYRVLTKGGGSKSKGANLTVDGKAGKATVKAIQEATGSKYSDSTFSGQLRNAQTKAFYSGISYGSNGSPSVKLFQKKIGANADGKIGAETIRKLQAHLGTPVDGKISRPSSVVIKELQRRLNKGTF